MFGVLGFYLAYFVFCLRGVSFGVLGFCLAYLVFVWRTWFLFGVLGVFVGVLGVFFGVLGLLLVYLVFVWRTRCLVYLVFCLANLVFVWRTLYIFWRNWCLWHWDVVFVTFRIWDGASNSFITKYVQICVFIL